MRSPRSVLLHLIIGAVVSIFVFGATPNAARAQTAPVITTLSAPRQVVALGGNLTLSATASGATSYQWRRKGIAIPGATNASYNITGAQVQRDSGWYQMLASNSSGSTTSAVVFVGVRPVSSQIIGWGNYGSAQLNIPSGLTDVQRIAAGNYLGVALKSDGTVVSWGGYFPPSGLTDVVDIAAGEYHAIALKADGSVVAWGYNGDGQGVVPAGLSNVVAIAAGFYHNLALRADGTVVAWGKSDYGAIAVPVGLTNVTAIAAGLGFSLALRADGTVVGWGDNNSGQSSAPSTVTNAIQIAAGAYHSVALRSDGTVTGWRAGNSGADVPANLSGVVAVEAGHYASLGLKPNGTVVGWGDSSPGGVLDFPADLGNVLQVSSTNGFALALREASGDLAPTVSVQPQSKSAFAGQDVSLSVTAAAGTSMLSYQWRKGGVAIASATGTVLTLPRVTSADAGSYDVLVTNQLGSITSQVVTLSVNTATAITFNLTGQQLLSVGQNLTLTVSTVLPGPVTYQWRRNGRAVAGATTASLSIVNATWRDAGAYQVVVTNTTGPVLSGPIFVSVAQSTQLLAWGSNSNGLTTIPTGLTNVMSISAGSDHTVALKSDGTVVAWGYTGNGQTNVPSGLTGIIAVAAGDTFTLALRADGTVATWGSINYTPSGLTNVIAIAAGSNYALALKSDGKLVAWHSSQIAVDIPLGLNDVVAIAAGPNHRLALKSDGTVVAWGSPDSGATIVPAGLGNIVGIAAGFARSFALKADGSVAAWGFVDKSFPATLAGVIEISSRNDNSFAVKADGTVVGWGPTSYPVGVLPGGLDHVFAVSAGNYHAVALRNSSGDAAPAIVTQPASLAAPTGQPLSLSVSATGGALSYQWRRNGNNVGPNSPTFTLNNPQTYDSGTYDVVISNYLGSVTSAIATLTVQVPVSITNHPTPQTVNPGANAAFSVYTSGTSPFTYQWRKDGTAISEATSATLSLNNVSAADAGSYDAVVSNSVSSTTSNAAALTVRTPAPGALVNLSSRMYVSGEGITGYFRIGGDTARTVLLRGVGPTLASFGVGGAMSDPQLQLRSASGTTIAANDNWAAGGELALTNAFAQVGAFGLTASSKDAALLVTLAPGFYSVRLSGTNGSAGEALFELYNVNPPAGGGFPYLAIRGPAGSSQTQITGFSVSGTAPSSLVFRAAGPSLFLTNPLSDPKLTLYSGSTKIAENDNWDTAANAAAISATAARFGAVVFPSGSKDSGLATVVQPGSYTAQVSSVSFANGNALLEIFDALAPEFTTAPYLISAPVSATSTVTLGQSASLYVAAGGSGPLSYQWRREGVAIDGATAAVSVYTPTATGTSSYDVVITNAHGSIIAPATPLTVVAATPPQILSGASNLAAIVGQNITLTVTVSGSSPLAYQWRKGGSTIVDATNASLRLTNVQVAHSGSYDVVVSNAAGTATSLITTLTVTPPQPPSITTQPASALLNVGNMARFFVTNTGTPPFTYQWRRNGVPIAGATSSSHGFLTTTASDAAAFEVVVSNSTGSVISAPATLSFGQLPLSASPKSQYVRIGEPVTLAITPVGGASPTYQWARNGIALTGATNATLSIAAVAPGDLGSYTVLADSEITTPTTRGPAVLALRGTGTLGRTLLAVGAAGTVLTSDDGLTWTSRVSGVTADLRGVASSGSLAVAVGAAGNVLTSPDAQTWSAVVPNSATDLNAVVAGPDRFVAVGAGGRVLVSTDGAAWYLAGSGTGSGLNTVTYGRGLYIFAGDSGTLFTSPDGFTWTNRNSETTSHITLVEYSGNQFWAVTATNQLLTSPEGVTWTRSAATTPAWLRSLAYDGQKLVAVGESERLSTSADGITWTPRTSGTAQNLLAVTWTGDEVPANYSATAFLDALNFRIIMPPLARSCSLGWPAEFSVTASGGDLTYQWSKDGTPISGATQSTLPFASVQPADIASYSVTVSSPAGVLTSVPVQLALLGTGTLGSQFLAVGDEGTILTSHDGVSFIERASGGGQVLRAVAASAFRAVAVGRDNAIAVSADGLNWSFRTLLLPGAPRILRGVAAGPTQFVAVGSAGTILVSLDQGDSWTLVASGTTQSLWSVAWDQSRFVAAGEGGVVLSSADGITWAAAASPIDERLYTIAATGTKLIAVTEQGQAFETTNSAATWQPAGTSSAWWVRGAASAPSGRCVAVGDRGVIATSANGISWSTASSPTSERLYGVVWTGVTAGLSGSVADAVNGPALRIISEPAAVTATAGSTASFNVSASGVGPLTFQWQRNGIDIADGNSATLLLANVQSADAGSFSVIVTNPTGSVVSAAAELTVVPAAAGVAPTVAESPASRSASVGGATNFQIIASGTAPLTYRWHFNGQAIPGAITSTLALSNLQLANAGSYSVTVTNAYGNVTSAPAVLTVTSVPGLPVITLQPIGQAIAAGNVVVFTVAATGAPAPTYQWRKDGAPIAGATAATLTIDPVSLSHAGVYTVAVSNTIGSVLSEPAGLTVVPSGTSATHTQTGGAGYIAGGTVTIANTFAFVGEAQSLGWEVLIPPGWTLASASGAQGDVKPSVGETQLLSWAWTNPPGSPVSFTYTLNVPAGATGSHILAAIAVLRQGGVPIRLMARPDPLIVAPSASLHSADTNGDMRLGLFELTRVIELYNTRNGTVRTGAYKVAASPTEDGFDHDAARAPGSAATLARHHSADTEGATFGSERDGAIGLFELTRVIELYNHRTDTVRTGQYHIQTGTEDGFAPGP